MVCLRERDEIYLQTSLVLGLVYKKGKFSALEDTQLETAIENYRMVCKRVLSVFILSLNHTGEGAHGG